MHWQTEWLDSALWIARTYAFALIGFTVAVLLASRWLRWGRQVRELAWPYFTPRRSSRPLAAVALILLMAIAGVRLNVLLSYWNNGFYDSIQALDEAKFWFFMGLFALLATLNVLLVLLTFYIGQAFDIYWRSWLNDRLTDDWLAGDAYYRARFLAAPGDNPDQRIQVDIGTFVTSSRTLAVGAVGAVVSLVSFTLILWQLSGPLRIGAVEVPRAMVMLVYAYVFVASMIAFKLGRPLIGLNFANQKLAANFRYALIRLREYAENIAFYRGEARERDTLGARFAAFIRNLWAIVFRTLKFDGFNLAVSQGAVVFPFLLQAQRFFSGAIKLGAVMQTAQAFGQVQDALSFFRTSYDSFAEYRAVLDRLSGFVAVNAQARALPRIDLQQAPAVLDIVGLSVRRPDGDTLVRELNLRLHPGEALLIQGASGVGKTTLLRALSGLWPYAQGTVRLPTLAQAMFLPQRPYLPLGSLAASLAYPNPPFDAGRLRGVLQQVQLAHLHAHLDDERDWTQVLSLGEQQRLAFARLLLLRPRIAFLDESTSAADEGLEHALYRTVRDALPECMLVSVGHRSTLQAFHTHRLELLGEGGWRFAPLRPGG